MGQEYIRLIADDANWLLDTAIVIAPAGDAKADKTAVPDNMMKAIVREQLGSLAAADRQKLNVAPDLGAAGSSITKAFAYRNVLDVLQEICDTARQKNDIWLGFDVVRTAPGVFEFRTYTGQRGQNHGRYSGDARMVGKNYGNLSGAKFGTYHTNERNYIVVGGSGEGWEREIVYRWDYTRWHASKWNRREYFKDSRDDTTTAYLEADGDAALEEYRPRQVLTGLMHDTPGMMYNIHYQFGDVLSADAFGYYVDCRVESVKVEVDQYGGEKIDIRLRGEL